MTWLRARLIRVLEWQLAYPGRKPDQDTPVVPPAGWRVWRMFLDLNNTRGVSSAGPLPISHQEIEAYGRLHRTPVRAFEGEIIRALDESFLKAARTPTDPKAPVVSSQSFSPAIFDALFKKG